MRTCQDFFHPAARRLWGSVIDVQDLLSLLPGITLSFAEPGVPELCGLNFVQGDVPDSLPHNFFDRFSLYASFFKFAFVKDVVWKQDGPSYTPRAMRALLAYSTKSPLLLNLKFTPIQNSHRLAQVPDLIKGYWNWPQMLLPPPLPALEIDGDYLPHAILADLEEIIVAAMHKCPELEHLELASGSRAPRSAMPLPSIFFDDQAPVLRKLHRLRCWNFPVCPGFIRWLHRMPNLAHVQLCYPKSASESPIQLALHVTPTLKNQVLFSPEAAATISLWHTAVIHRLTQLSISFSTEKKWSPAKIVEFFRLVSDRSRTLADFTLVLVDRGIPILLASSFLPLKHPPIRSLTIIGGLGDHWRLDIMRDIALSWPSLRELHMQMFSCSIRNLAHILPYCLDLTTFYIDTLLLDVDKKNGPGCPTNAQLLPNHVYQHLTMVSDFGFWETYDGNQLETFAQYLAGLRPNMKCAAADPHMGAQHVLRLNDALRLCYATAPQI